MKRFLSALVTLSALLAFLSVNPASPALAEEGTLKLSEQAVAPGGHIDVSGGGFDNDSGLSLSLQGDVVVDLGRLAADGKGSFSTNVAIPTDVATGRYSVTAAGVAPDNSARILTAPLVVSGDPNVDPDGQLPADDTSPLWIVLITAVVTALLVSGLWILVYRRRAVRPSADPLDESQLV